MFKYLFLVFFVLNFVFAVAQPSSLPLIQMSDWEYEGAFIVPPDDFGESDANYAVGTIALNSANNSFYLAGHSHDRAIAEFTLPELVNSTELSELNTAEIIQDFKALLDSAPGGNPQNIDIISGMQIIDGQLFINAVEYYDAPANNTHTTLIVENPDDLENTAVSDYYALDGAAHAAGWISPIPEEWQSVSGGSYLAGNSSKYPISGRLPIGTSAFAFNPTDFAEETTVPTVQMADFSLAEPLHADYADYENPYYNLIEVNGDTSGGHTFEDADAVVGENAIWTANSEASYGFIVPGTRTYLTIGASGGHNSGIGYKATQNDGNLCGGPCPYDADDRYNYYWLWDMNDLTAAMNGTIDFADIRPYEYGVFDAPFQTDAYSGGLPEFHPIRGGAYDPLTGKLYLTIFDGGASGSPYRRNPAVAVYTLNNPVSSLTSAPTKTLRVFPNPTDGRMRIITERRDVAGMRVSDAAGRTVRVLSFAPEADLSGLPAGVYFLEFLGAGKEVLVTERVLVR